MLGPPSVIPHPISSYEAEELQLPDCTEGVWWLASSLLLLLLLHDVYCNIYLHGKKVVPQWLCKAD